VYREDGKTYGGILGGFRAAALECDTVALVLETLRSNQALDLGGLGVGLGALLLGLDLTADDKLADLNYARLAFMYWTSDSAGHKGNGWRRSYERTHIIFLAETEEAADLGCALGTETLGVNLVGQAGDIGIALLDDGQSEDGQVHGDDAAADGLALALTGAAGTVAGVAVSEEETDTGRVHDTLLHRETLLVVSTGDPEDVALELVTDRVTGNLLTHAAVHEDAELALVFDLDQLLRAIVGVGDVELHLDGGVATAMCCNVSRLVVEAAGNRTFGYFATLVLD
jgi:hypothetical protein